MGWLMSYRKGWESQNVARMLLYRFSFLSEPVHIADDIGGDYFCTLFQSNRVGSNTYLAPRNSFAIQVKSKNDITSNLVPLTKQRDFLLNLEIPYFIGVVDREKLQLKIFSGQYLTPFFSYKEPRTIEAFEAELCDPYSLPDLFAWLSEPRPLNYILRFPLVAEISATTSDDEVQELVVRLQRQCTLMLQNIARKLTHRYMFNCSESPLTMIFAGETSRQHFNENFLQGLAEAFYNLQVACSTEGAMVATLFPQYEQVFIALVASIGEANVPDYVRDTYQNAKKAIHSTQ
jgi:hypothetical protein